MKFGPNNFENLEQLLSFITDDVFKASEDQTTHPLRTAIAEHVLGQNIQQDDEIPANLTRTARERLSDIFQEKATDAQKTPQEYLVHCFWDGLRKTSGNLNNALDFSPMKEITLNADRPIERTHHLILAQLKTNVYFYRKNFSGQNTETNEAFEKALLYLEDTITTELERLLAEEFSLEPGNSAKFKQHWETTARTVALERDNEGKAVERPSQIPGKPPRTSYPHNFGYDGVMPTLESLGL